MSAPRPRAVYLDHAATTPMRPAALSALTAALAHTGNPSSLHTAGRAARRTVEEARERLAAAVGARPSEVVWTAGGTEADNLAVKGLFWARRTHDTARRRVVVSAVEHHAVLDPAFWLAEHAGAELVLLPVDGDGVVEVDALREELEAHADTVALVSVMWANNEVGALQPLDDVVALAHRHGVPVHADAVQAVGQVPVDLGACGVDAVTLSGHKVGGPGSTGALLVRRGLELTPVLHGGGQERGVRSGTLDPALLAAFAVAVEDAVAERDAHAARVGALRDDLVRRVLATVPGATLRGPADAARRLPANAHLTFAGCEGDSLLYLLDAAGVEVSTGSACQAGVPRPSHVLLAMGVGEDDARGALRFSFGAGSSAADVDAAVAALPGAVERARAAGLSTLVGV
ncbi:cysteine desulfurase family protein [Cellulomonas phragmiteti]|uniref:cysteine desulfurase n=1 Tax=Cellulomonas phragmiteti TaxID=478780 RepID=A0ABQ4DL30_9CELL|nr:cysteine desulfurase family protein [Cellulomonas phragmiteti]GIG40052.1 cysteine desulfurase [Cellulomonas phragmiteti]